MLSTGRCLPVEETHERTNFRKSLTTSHSATRAAAFPRVLSRRFRPPSHGLSTPDQFRLAARRFGVGVVLPVLVDGRSRRWLRGMARSSGDRPPLPAPFERHVAAL